MRCTVAQEGRRGTLKYQLGKTSLDRRGVNPFFSRRKSFVAGAKENLSKWGSKGAKEGGLRG